MAQPPPVIDIHSHFLPVAFSVAADLGKTRYGIEFGRDPNGLLVFRIGDRWFPLQQGRVYDDTPSERAARLDLQRIDLQLVSLSPSVHLHMLAAGPAEAFARDCNEALADLVDGAPGRFRGLAFLPLQAPGLAIAELERVMADRRFVGAMVGTNVNGTDWDDPGLVTVLEAAQSLGALVLVHPAGVRAPELFGRYHLRNLIGNPLETTLAIASVIFSGVLDRLPGVKLCFAHGGGYACWGAGRLDQGRRVRPEAGSSHLPSDYLGRLYFDSLTYDELALRHLLDRVGTERVMLGTDFPTDMALAQPVGWIESCRSLTATERTAILGGTARAVLPTSL